MSTPYDDQSARPGPPAGYPASGSQPQRTGFPAASSGSSQYPDGTPAHPYDSSPPGSGDAIPSGGAGFGGSSSAGRSGDVQPAVPPADTGSHGPAAGFDSRGHVQRGRISTVWITLIVAAIGLILLIVFIAQNSRVVPIHFLGLAGHLAIGLTVLIAAVVGLLLAAIPGTIRIVQLRKALKTNVPKDQRTA